MYNKIPEKKYYFIILISLFITTFIAIISYRFLYLDGAYFFDSLLFKHDFNTFDKPRAFAQYITQAPTIFALKYFHIENKNTLMLIYDTTLYGIPLLSLVLSYQFLENKKLIFFPLTSYLFSSLHAFSFIISEAHIMAAFFWLALILILRQKLTFLQQVFLILLLISATHFYESYLLLSIILAFSVIYRMFLTNSKKEFLFWATALIIIIYGFSVALYSYFHPRDIINAGQFTKSLISILKSKNLQLFIIIFVISFLIFKKSISIVIPILLFLSTFLIIYIFPEYMEITKAYSGRTLLTLIPLIFGFLFLLLHIFWPSISLFYDKVSIRLANATILIAAIFIGLHIAISIHWYKYIQIFKIALHHNQKQTLKLFHQTIVSGRDEKYKIANKFYLIWTYPFTSYAISNEPIINLLVSDNHHSLPEPYTNTHTMKDNEVIYNNSYEKIYKYMITKINPNEIIYTTSNKVYFDYENKMETSIMFHLNISNPIIGLLTLNLENIPKEKVQINFNNTILKQEEPLKNSINITFKFDPKIIRWNYTDIIKLNSTLKIKSFSIH